MLATQTILEDIFPRDIAELIHDKAARMDHQSKLVACFQPLRVNYIIREHDRVYTSFNTYDGPHLFDEQEWFQDNFKNIKDAIEVLGSCTCCDTHQTDRPCSIDSPEDTFIIASKKDEYVPKPCKCKCRHIARKFMLYAIGSCELFAKMNRITLHDAYIYKKRRMIDFTGDKASHEYTGIAREMHNALLKLHDHMNQWPHVKVPQDYDNDLMKDLIDINSSIKHLYLDRDYDLDFDPEFDYF